ncbi:MULTISPECIES: potassium channel family protein [unclassified Sedimentibacter]|uniref:potassium channel family protein n=1 Tax=unclassified Sedimentibacter TaxID=2649220 RepID=UPI0027E02868|nr:TrkA family potassium uptake protein [Sedimentibacter sp. MB35-C1]WMJ76070.1 TrkA family potassium uptake protein [Sedimentibacter sp. MB35-C1]
MIKKYKNKSFAVLGLGRFGMSIIQTLSEYDVNIMACDNDKAKLKLAEEYATHVVRADASDENALKNLGLQNFDVIILAMGEEFEASQIATMIAKESGAKHVIVKARNLRQKKILESIGADSVVLPEHEMGSKLARKMVASNIMDILEDSEYYTITEIKPLDEWLDKSLRQANIRQKHNITILAVRQGEELILPVSPDRIINKEDILIALEEKNK